jgi:ankyrin repeat protein
MEASWNKHTEMVKLLLKHGADVNKQDEVKIQSNIKLSNIRKQQFVLIGNIFFFDFLFLFSVIIQL